MYAIDTRAGECLRVSLPEVRRAHVHSSCFLRDAFRCDACGAMNPMREDWIAQLRAMASLAGKVTL